MNEQETHKQETDEPETVKQETIKVVELNTEETEQVVGGVHVIRHGPDVLRR